MLNDEDIKKLTAVFTTKEDFKEMRADILGMRGDVSSIKNDVKEIKSEMEDLKELIQGLIISSDSLVKSMGELKLEYAAISTQLSRHERWIKEIAEKVGLKLAME